RERQAGKLRPAEYERRERELMRDHRTRVGEQNRQAWEQAAQTTWIVNLVVPPGWLPLSATELAEGNPLPAVLGTLGLGLIGAASLGRSYRTTVRLYTGQFTAKKRRPAATAPPATVAEAPRTLLVGRQLPSPSTQPA